jgi:hypothetical protein
MTQQFWGKLFFFVSRKQNSGENCTFAKFWGKQQQNSGGNCTSKIGFLYTHEYSKPQPLPKDCK